MVSKSRKIIMCLLIIASLTELSTEFVLGSISERLTIKIQDFRRLIVQEQERTEKQRKSREQICSPVATTYTNDGHKHVTAEFITDFSSEATLSGETVGTYLLRILDLETLKATYDLWRDYIFAALISEVYFILGLRAVWELKRRNWWQTDVSRICCTFHRIT